MSGNFVFDLDWMPVKHNPANIYSLNDFISSVERGRDNSRLFFLSILLYVCRLSGALSMFDAGEPNER